MNKVSFLLAHRIEIDNNFLSTIPVHPSGMGLENRILNYERSYYHNSMANWLNQSPIDSKWNEKKRKEKLISSVHYKWLVGIMDHGQHLLFSITKKKNFFLLSFEFRSWNPTWMSTCALLMSSKYPVPKSMVFDSLNDDRPWQSPSSSTFPIGKTKQ